MVGSFSGDVYMYIGGLCNISQVTNHPAKSGLDLLRCRLHLGYYYLTFKYKWQYWLRYISKRKRPMNFRISRRSTKKRGTIPLFFERRSWYPLRFTPFLGPSVRFCGRATCPGNILFASLRSCYSVTVVVAVWRGYSLCCHG